MSIISATDVSSFVVAVDKGASSQNQSRPSVQEPHAMPTSVAASAHQTSDREPVDDIRVGLERKEVEIYFIINSLSSSAMGLSGVKGYTTLKHKPVYILNCLINSRLSRLAARSLSIAYLPAISV